MNRSSLATQVFDTFLDILFPRRCPVCHEILGGDEGIHSRCASAFHPVGDVICRRCGKAIEMAREEYCRDCAENEHFFSQGRALWKYEGEVRRSIHRYKYRGCREYGAYYGQEMARQFEDQILAWRADAIVPIPLHPSRRRRRGFDQTAQIAASLKRELDQRGRVAIEVREDILRRARVTRPQKKLSKLEREANLAGAFRVRAGAKIPQRIILIDDIYTTGSTIDAAAKSLRIAGAQRVFFLALAVGAELA